MKEFKRRLRIFGGAWLLIAKVVTVIAVFIAVNVAPIILILEKTDSDWAFASMLLTLPVTIAFVLACMDADI